MPHMGETLGLAIKPGSGGSSGSIAWADITGKPALPVSGSLVVTVPDLTYEHEQAVSAAGVTSSMKVLLAVAPHLDADENHETMLDLAALSGEAGAGAITVRIGFGMQTSGPIRLNYMAI